MKRADHLRGRTSGSFSWPIALVKHDVGAAGFVVGEDRA